MQNNYPTASAPQVDPGIGYRMLQLGEKIEQGDEFNVRALIKPLTYEWRANGERAGDTYDLPWMQWRRKITIVPPSTAAATAAKDATNAVNQLHTEFIKVTAEAAKAAQEIKQLQEQISDLEVNNQKLRAQLDAMQKNASGNAVLVRRDGFSKPMTVPVGLRHLVMPKFAPDFRLDSVFSRFETIEFRLTGKTDGFGRAIFQEV